MSRSCQVTTFSKAGMTVARTTRASPVRFSDRTGLRLCGIADEPFWPSAKYSDASRSSVRCRWRISVASRSTPAAISASAMKNAAWRSRGMICVDTGSGTRPSFFATCASTRGSMLAKVPTAPEIAQVAISRRAVTRRSRLRANSAQWPASFSPNVVGSAWTPWLRPIVGVYLCSTARRFSAASTRSRSATRRSAASFSCTARQVSSTSLDVMPWWTKARLGADMLGEVGEERDRLVMRLALDLGDARDLEGALVAHRARRALRDHAERRLGLAGIGLDVELDAESVLGLPDRRHLRPAVARDHAGCLSVRAGSVRAGVSPRSFGPGS